MSGNWSRNARIGAGSDGQKLRRRVVEVFEEDLCMFSLAGPSRTPAAASIEDIVVEGWVLCWFGLSAG